MIDNNIQMGAEWLNGYWAGMKAFEHELEKVFSRAWQQPGIDGLTIPVNSIETLRMLALGEGMKNIRASNPGGLDAIIKLIELEEELNKKGK